MATCLYRHSPTLAVVSSFAALALGMAYVGVSAKTDSVFAGFVSSTTLGVVFGLCAVRRLRDVRRANQEALDKQNRRERSMSTMHAGGYQVDDDDVEFERTLYLSKHAPKEVTVNNV